jgi:hypothetical protein
MIRAQVTKVGAIILRRRLSSTSWTNRNLNGYLNKLKVLLIVALVEVIQPLQIALKNSGEKI